jgi:hypothetical protein
MDDGEEIPLLVDRSGMPHTLANAYVQASFRNTGRSPATQDGRLRGIGRALAYFDAADINIAARVGGGDYLSLEELNGLAAACTRRIESSSGNINGATAGLYWDASMGYILWRADTVIGNASGSRKIMLVAQRERFKTLAEGQRPRPSQGSQYIDRLGLAPALRPLLLRAIEPGSVDNPFQRKLQKRNYALIILAYELGFREGEELSLRVRDYDTRADPPTILVQPRAPDPVDTRKVKPRVKTMGRLLQPPEHVLLALDDWLVELRDRAAFPNAKRHPYLFVETTGEPLALRSLRSIYERIVESCPELKGLGPHIVRHTTADMDTEKADAEGWPEDAWQRHMEYKFGWAEGSNQPGKYAKGATGRAVNRRLREQQRRDLGKE